MAKASLLTSGLLLLLLRLLLSRLGIRRRH